MPRHTPGSIELDLARPVGAELSVDLAMGAQA